MLLWKPLPLQLPSSLHLVILLLGFAIYISGIWLYLWGYKTLGGMYSPSSSFSVQLYENHQLVVDGPYAVVRHPMYLGVIMAAVGGLLVFRTWAMVLFALSALVVLLRARREEKILSVEFGTDWEEYCKRVPGWIPRKHRV